MTIPELNEDILRPLGSAAFFRHTMGTVCMYELVYVYICKFIYNIIYNKKIYNIK